MKTLKTITLIILTTMLSFALSYSSIVFVELEVDFRVWGKAARFLYLFAGAIFSIISAIIIQKNV